jgi:hypothetical protein
MKIYNRIWSAFWSVAAAVGLGLAMLESSAIAALLILGLLLALAWLVRHLMPDLMPGWPSMTVAIGILAVLSFCRVVPPLGLLLVLTAGLSSPAVVGQVIRSARRPTKAHADEGAADTTLVEPRPEGVDADCLTLPEAMGPLQGLDDLQLCRLWRESFWVLRRPAPPVTVLCLVALREACLDELERRDAAALHAWLDSGARASGGPEKYLAHPPRRETGAG